MWKVHGVHIHLGEEWSWSGDDWRDSNLVGLAGLALVEYPLAGTLCIALPENIVVNEET